MKETKGGRWNKQRWGRRESEIKWYFLLCLACCVTFWPYYFMSWTESLMFNYWKHSGSPSPAKQYPAYISSSRHLTDGNIKIWCQVEGVGAESGRAEGGKWAWLQLIVTIMKPLLKTATCQETTNTKEHKTNIALTLIVPGKCAISICKKDIKAHFIFMNLLRGYGDCCHPQGPGRVTLYYHIKT